MAGSPLFLARSTPFPAPRAQDEDRMPSSLIGGPTCPAWHDYTEAIARREPPRVVFRYESPGREGPPPFERVEYQVRRSKY